jgi:hypothetical protein
MLRASGSFPDHLPRHRERLNHKNKNTWIRGEHRRYKTNESGFKAKKCFKARE